VDVSSRRQKAFPIASPLIREAPLPYWKLRSQTMRKAAFDEPYSSFERDVLRCQQKMHMLWHDDEIMQEVVSLTPIVLESLNEEIAVYDDLKQAPAIVGRGGDQERS
jgi:hypothetical protein